MANEYAVNQADLEAVADAIREKGGTSDALTFPDGFVDAVGAIEAGSGGISLDISGATLKGIVPFEINDESITRIEKLIYSDVTRIDCPNVTYVENLKNNSRLEYFNFENLSRHGAEAFRENKKLIELIAPKLEPTGQRGFDSCTSLEYIRLDSTKDFGWQWYFANCTSLKTCIAPSASSYVGAGTFNSCKVLTTLVLGNVNSTSVLSLVNVNAFTNTPLGGISGVYSGHIYVPSALIAEYQAATNWSTLYANYPDIFQPIEGSEYE